jgi:hypothetical protein
VSRLLAAQRALTVPGWAKDELSRKAQSIPSLDLRFAENKSLVDATTGSNLVTFTRASSGTFVGSDGVIQTATTNLLLRSEEFDNASWTKGASTTVTANYAVGPFGGLTADRVEMPNTIGTVVSQSVTTVSGLGYVFSVYARATSGSSPLIIQLGTAIESVTLSETWQRYSVSFTATGSSLTAQIDNGNNVIDVVVWGAQLEQSSTVGEYIPTTSTINSAPRFDHNPTTGESLGLLVEEARTNLLVQSEDFSTTWTADTGNPTLSTNVATSPNGTTTADKLIEGTASGGQNLAQAVSISTAGQYTFSVYAKAAERFKFLLRESTSTGAAALYSLTTSSVLALGGGGTPAPTASIQPLANGWFRCTLTMNQASTGNRTFRVYVVDDAETTLAGSIANRTGDGTSGLFIWGAQLEAGAFPTSYIPSTTATVTRSADVASISGSNFSAWYRQDEGTVFGEALIANAAASGAQIRRIADLNDGTANNRISFGHSAAQNTLRVLYRESSTDLNGTNGQTTSNVFPLAKVAIAIKASDYAYSANGLTPVTSSGANIPVVDRLTIGGGSGTSNEANGTIRRLTYWPTRLSNSTLQAVTQ